MVPVLGEAWRLLKQRRFALLLVASSIFSAGHASYDLCSSLYFRDLGAGRDTIVGFDANLDTIDLTGLGMDHWDVSDGIFHAYLAGDAVADLEIALPGLIGTLNDHPGHVLI